MRGSNRTGRAETSGLLFGATLALVLVACTTGAAPTIAPTARPTPVVTPDPHLSDPASVDVIYSALRSAGLRVIANTAGSGSGGEPVKRINATFEDWPLILHQFSSGAALRAAGVFDPATAPRQGDAPFALVGLNILVEYGPRTTNDPVPPTPDDRRRTAILSIVDVLDPLLGPLEQRAVDPVRLPGTPVPLPSTPQPSDVEESSSP